MAIVLNDNIKINAGKPSEAKYLNPNTNTPYTGTTQVNILVPISERHRGLTVLINGEEYWYRDGVSNLDLILKTTTGSGGGDGEKLEKEFTQTSHGFLVGNVVEYSGGTFQKALAVQGRNSEIIGWVSEVIDANTFKLVLNGYVDGISELTLLANTTYYLSSTVAGGLTSIEPTIPTTISKPILTTLTNNDALIFQYRGFLNTTGATGNNTGFTSAINIGTGQTIYDDSILNTLQFRTLKSGDNISVVTVGDEIEFNFTGQTNNQNIYNSKRIVSGSITLLLSDHVILVSATTAITLTLPNTGLNDGQTYKIKDLSGAFSKNITIDGDGIDIEQGSVAVINTDRGALEIVYDNNVNEWIILNFIS